MSIQREKKEKNGKGKGTSKVDWNERGDSLRLKGNKKVLKERRE